MRLSRRTLQVFWAVWILGILLSGLALYLINTPLVAVTQESCNAIRPGMSVQQASGIIGGLPRWYDGINSYGAGVPVDKNPVAKFQWVSSDGHIVVYLDDNSRITRARFEPITVASQDWPHLCWERLVRGCRGDDVAGIALLVLAVLAVAACWYWKLLGIARVIVATEAGVPRAALRFRIASWAFVCTVGKCASFTHNSLDAKTPAQ